MDSNLQSKLHEFSATPPQGVWNKIADALDSEADYARRLYAYEQQPPASAWEKIDAALADQEPAKVVPLYKKIGKPLRYVAAASIIAVVLITISLTVRRTKAGDLQATNHAGATVSVTEATAKPDNDTFHPTNSNPEKSKQQLPATNKTGTGLTGTNVQTATAQTAPKKPAVSTVRYLLYNDDDGNVVRVSKKVAGFINCKDGDVDCQQRLKKLRQTLATKATTADFTGILEMLHQLQQKP